MVDYSNKGTVWYAMQTTYKRELKAKAFLEAHSIECFIPMQQEIQEKYGKKKVIETPAIHNLIFIKADIALINDLKSQLDYLHNKLTRHDAQLKPIIVPDFEMEKFIAATSASLEKVIYIDLSTTQLDKGTKVRIIGGDFEGAQGTLTKVKGKRSKRVVINIKGVIAYAVEVDSAFIEAV